jgi:uncharacterized pyridoxamine 5'-phosphate oxidase family protein
MRTLYKNSGYTSQRTQYALNRRANLVIVVNNKKSLFVVRITWNTNTLCGQNSNFSTLKLDGTYSYHWASES